MIIVFMLMRKLEKLTMEVIIPMCDIVVFSLCLLRVGEVHNIFRSSFHLHAPFMFDKASVLLGKKGTWLD